MSIYAAAKKEILSLAVLPAAGATTLQLDADPTGWRTGDELVVAPTLYDQDEVVQVTSISGRTIGIWPALKFTRTKVPEPWLKVHVGNLTRNVLVATEASQAGNKRLAGACRACGGSHRQHHACDWRNAPVSHQGGVPPPDRIAHREVGAAPEEPVCAKPCLERRAVHRRELFELGRPDRPDLHRRQHRAWRVQLCHDVASGNQHPSAERPVLGLCLGPH